AVGGIVAAVRTAALLARAEVDPRAADLHALIANVLPGVLDRLNRINVRTARIRHISHSDAGSDWAGSETFAYWSASTSMRMLRQYILAPCVWNAMCPA